MLQFHKRLVWGGGLEAEIGRSYPCQQLTGRGNALQREQLVYEELKRCLEMSRARVE